MGFAKYQEDIVSRYVGDLAMRSIKVPVSPPKPSSPNAKNQPDQRTKKMSSLKKFAVATPRPLPVIVLADTSGSMGENGKIEALNCWRRLNSDPPCRSNIDPGRIAEFGISNCG